MKKTIRCGIIVLLLILAYGFAMVTTNLVLNNSLTFGFNNHDFDVYFSYAFPETNGNAVIANDKHSITYTTHQMQNVGDTATIEVFVTNNSSQYDVDTKLLVSAIDSTYGEYYTITYTDLYNDQFTNIDAKKTMKGVITITLTNALPSSMSLGFDIALDMNSLERTDYGEVRVYNANEIEYNHGSRVTNVKEALDDLRRRFR